MGLRAFLIVAAVLAGSAQVVEAAEQSPLRRVSCTVVRFYVAKYSAGAAEAHLGDSTNFNAKPVPVSDTIVAQNGGDPTIKDQLEATAEVIGLAEAVRTGKL